jgi:preprotein translocase subunit SecG
LSKKKKNIIPSNYSGSNDYYPENIDKISYKDEDSDYWQNFRNDVIKVREKSQDDFEKYLNVFGSGGLLVGLTLLSKLVESKLNYEFQWMLILGSILFVICLLSNLFSHYMAIDNNDKNISDIDNQNPNLWENFDKRNKQIGNLNNVSVCSIILGTILITLFLILNINTMAKQNTNPQSQPKSQPKGQAIPEGKKNDSNKGRTTVNPTFQKPPQKK